MTENTGETKDIYQQHADLVAELAKPGEDILATLTPEKVDLWHNTTGQNGESGELTDAIKKYVIYGKDLDRENVIEELGDLEFYLQGIRRNLNITREETLVANIAKLRKRYAKGYSDKAAQERADKVESEFSVGTRVLVSIDYRGGMPEPAGMVGEVVSHPAPWVTLRFPGWLGGHSGPRTDGNTEHWAFHMGLDSNHLRVIE